MKRSAQKEYSTLDLLPVIYPDADYSTIHLSLAVSILVHLLIFASLFYANVHLSEKMQKNIEVVYRMAAGQIKQAKVPPPQDVKSVRDQELSSPPKVLVTKDSAHAAMFRNVDKQPAKLEMPQKQLSKLRALEGKRQVAIPVLNSEKITNPKYLDYNDRIRNKIKERAYLYVDDPAFQKGEVYLTFVISSAGHLKDVKIIDDKTKANNYLRSIGLRSIKESNPFPAFPLDLRYPELSFNVVISFQIGE